MNFENVTALELHLHTNEKIESEPARQKRPVVKTETPTSKMKSLGLMVVMIVVSVLLSLVVTVLVRKLESAFGDEESAN